MLPLILRSFRKRRFVAWAFVAASAGTVVACDQVTAPIKALLSPTPATLLLNPSGNVVVSPDSMRGWAFYDDQHSVACTDQTVCSLVAGPSGQPLGAGSATLATPLATDGYALILPDYKGTRFDHITSLHYSTFRQSVDQGNNLAIALQFNVDFDLTDAATGYQGRLVFEPYRTAGGAVLSNTWQDWDAKAGKWWGTKTSVSRGGVAVPNPCVQSSPCTWTQLLSSFPNLGVHNTLGAVVLKAGSSWPGFRGNIDMLSIGVDGVTTTFDFETVQYPVRTLVILADPGVSGYPGAGDTTVTSGGVIPYAFHAAAGSMLKVYVDSIAVPDSGTVTMNGQHSLFAVIQPDTVLRSEDLPIYNAIRTYLTAAQPHAAFQSFINTLVISMATQNESSADSSYSRASSAAIDLVRDSVSLDRVDAALAGHVFDFPDYEDVVAMRSPNAGAVARAAIAPRAHVTPTRSLMSSGDSGDSSIVVFINGSRAEYNHAVWSDLQLKVHLRSDAEGIPALKSKNSARIEFLYNPMRSEHTATLSRKLHCLEMDYGTRDSYFFWIGAVCNLASWVFDSDAPRAFEELGAVLNGRYPADSVTNAAGDSILAWRAANRNVILVPASEGNLVATIALHNLQSSGKLKRNGDRTCVAVVPVASMTTDYSSLPSKYVKPVQLLGDGVLQFPGSHYPGSTSWLNDSLSQARGALRGPIARGLQSLKDARLLHLFESYVSISGGQSLLIAAIGDAYRACAVSSVTVTPRPDSLAIGTSLQFDARAVNGAGDTLINIVPTFEGDVSSSGLMTVTSSGYRVVVARVRYARSLPHYVNGYLAPPVITAASCSKGAVTTDYVNQYTRYTFAATGIAMNAPTDRITAYRFEMQISRPNHADYWSAPDNPAMVADGSSGTATTDWRLTLEYADGPEVEGQAKPNGHCRVIAYDLYQKASIPYLMSY